MDRDALAGGRARQTRQLEVREERGNTDAQLAHEQAKQQQKDRRKTAKGDADGESASSRNMVNEQVGYRSQKPKLTAVTIKTGANKTVADTKGNTRKAGAEPRGESGNWRQHVGALD